jgi:hypothetical protein
VNRDTIEGSLVHWVKYWIGDGVLLLFCELQNLIAFAEAWEFVDGGLWSEPGFYRLDMLLEFCFFFRVSLQIHDLDSR